MLRTFLVLGRVSNLPTVWSNCVAGWWLGGAADATKLPWLFLGITFLYQGGMFLNDAFDVEFDRQHRSERPIPSGKISFRAVWRWGLAWLAAGWVCLFYLGREQGWLGLALVASIVVYDAVHKQTPMAPVLMGTCRFLVYVIAASTGVNAIGLAVWCGLALLSYVVGLSYLARQESKPDRLRYWPISLLAVPIFVAMLLNTGEHRQGTILISAILVLWIIRALRHIFLSPEPSMGRAVSFLLAGIVLVDWLAAADAPNQIGFVFIGLFVSALILQRTIPAT